jgi:signal transduction histidine kinase
MLGRIDADVTKMNTDAREAAREDVMLPEPFRDARILFVDDERSMVRLLEELLAHAGYRALRSTTDPRQVLHLCGEFQPDLILLDLRMPNLDGVQVLRGLKTRRAEAYLPVLVLTADVSRESKREALEAGASDFVTKPFEQIELLLRVRNLIEMRFLHKDLRRQNDDLETQIQERTHQLLEAEKLATMGNLLAGVAHELNSPLSVILGQVGLFATSGVDPKARARIKDIGEAAERCVRIVRSFLTMARRHPPERGHVSLNHLLRDAVELLAFELRIANVEVSFDLQKDLPLVWADAHQLKQVVVNLITNARQAVQDAAPPRRLCLRTRCDAPDQRVRIEVADSGPGVPGEIRARTGPGPRHRRGPRRRHRHRVLAGRGSALRDRAAGGDVAGRIGRAGRSRDGAARSRQDDSGRRRRARRRVAPGRSALARRLQGGHGGERRGRAADARDPGLRPDHERQRHARPERARALSRGRAP